MLHLTDSVEQSAEKLRRRDRCSRSLCCYSSGCRRDPKNIGCPIAGPQSFGTCKRVSGFPVCSPGVAMRRNCGISADIIERSRDTSRIFNLAGKIDFLLSAAIIRGGTLFAGVDTAAAHVASAFRRPELVLFGPTNPFHWRPKHASAVVVRAGFKDPLDHIRTAAEGASDERIVDRNCNPWYGSGFQVSQIATAEKSRGPQSLHRSQISKDL